jgi:hypothetical protein
LLLLQLLGLSSISETNRRAAKENDPSLAYEQVLKSQAQVLLEQRWLDYTRIERPSRTEKQRKRLLESLERQKGKIGLGPDLRVDILIRELTQN